MYKRRVDTSVNVKLWEWEGSIKRVLYLKRLLQSSAEMMSRFALVSVHFYFLFVLVHSKCVRSTGEK